MDFHTERQRQHSFYKIQIHTLKYMEMSWAAVTDAFNPNTLKAEAGCELGTSLVYKS